MVNARSLAEMLPSPITNPKIKQKNTVFREFTFSAALEQLTFNESGR